MNIILVPDRSNSSRHASLSHGHIITMAIVGLVFLPVLFGVVTYRIDTMIARYNGTLDSDIVVRQQQELQAQREAIQEARSNAENHLNALAQRLGHLQAQVIRLNALGGRLTRMAGLDPKEFDFSKEPGMGGPEEPSVNANGSMILASLKHLDDQVSEKSEQLTALESLLIDRQTQKALTPSGWPIKGWVSSPFGIRADPFTGRLSMHTGVDIAAPIGTVIHAMGDGVITYSGPRFGYGNMVEINHGHGYRTRYAHLEQELVRVGDRVSKGQPIGLLGDTGRSTGPHVHVEVLVDNRKVNPISFLEKGKADYLISQKKGAGAATRAAAETATGTGS
jgi:murein DD-endopeptidase MepM/ murein hydrolase activator NlpD